YDFIFIDSPPSLDLLTLNGLCACDTLLVPIQCEFFALEGLSELMNTVRSVKKMYNPYLELEGVLLTMYDGRLNLTLQVVQEVKKYFGDKVYQTTIPRNVRLSEAPSFGAPINYYDPGSKGAEAYAYLAAEVVKNNRER
ncbi:MAG: ParA family protein, partial [Ruthenibacterium sp.]